MIETDTNILEEDDDDFEEDMELPQWISVSESCLFIDYPTRINSIRNPVLRRMAKFVAYFGLLFYLFSLLLALLLRIHLLSSTDGYFEVMSFKEALAWTVFESLVMLIMFMGFLFIFWCIGNLVYSRWTLDFQGNVLFYTQRRFLKRHTQEIFLSSDIQVMQVNQNELEIPRIWQAQYWLNFDPFANNCHFILTTNPVMILRCTASRDRSILVDVINNYLRC